MVNVTATSKFPTTLLAQADVGVFGNNEVARLTADITSGDTVWSLNDVTLLEADQWLALRGPNGFEIVQISSVDAMQSQVTVTRAQDGTTAVAHLEGQEIKATIPAIALNQLRVDLIGVETWIGVDGDCITWDRALKLSPTHDTCPILELDLSTATTNTEFIRFSVDGVQTGAMLYDSANDAVEFQNVRVDIGTGADLLLEDNRIIRLGTDSDAQVLYRSADDRIEFISDKDFRFEQVDGTEAVTIDTNAAIITNIDIDPRTDSARSLGNASARYLEGHFDRLLLATDAAAPSHTEGMLFYDATDNDKSLSFYIDESEITLNVGQELLVRVRNETGGVISDGEAVYVNGVHGGTGLPTVAKAQANALATSEAIGLATHDIEDNSFGYITTYGKVRGINTAAFLDGAELFLSATTPGALTSTRPSLPNFGVRIGIVTRSNMSNGSILVEVDGPREGAYTTARIPFGGSDGYLDESAELRFDSAANTTIHGSAAGAGITISGSAQASRIQINQEAGIGNVGVLNLRHTDTAGLGAHLAYARSRNTAASPAIVQDGDSLALITGHGYDGADYEPAARIGIEVDGVPGLNDMPGRIVFLTTSDGAATLTERARITQAGHFLPGTDSAYDIGESSTPKRWRTVYADTIDAATFTTGFTQGSVIFADGSGNLAEDNSEFFWDNSAKELALGTTSPDTKLHVHLGTAGAVASDANAIATFENSTTGYLQLLVPTTATTGILFGDTDDPDVGAIKYNHANNRMGFWQSGSEVIELTGSAFHAVDDTLNLGAANKRWSTAHSKTFQVEAASADANPVAILDVNGLSFGAGAGSAVDVVLSRGDTNRLDFASGDHLQMNNGDIRFDNASVGVILKDTQGSPHYWRVTVDNTGALVTTDLGTSLPST